MSKKVQKPGTTFLEGKNVFEIAMSKSATDLDAKFMSSAQLQKMLMDVIALKKGERVVFLTDYPEKPEVNDVKEDRKQLIASWMEAAKKLSTTVGFEVLPLVKYAETGAHGAQLPTSAYLGDKQIDNLTELLSGADVIIAMNSFSATATLHKIADLGNTRVLSMPTVDSTMEPAMSANYAVINGRGLALLDLVKDAVGFRVEFKGEGVPEGTQLYVDTRANVWKLDGGKCTQPGELINFPAGELFTPPYEGVSENGRKLFGDSKTSGTWAVYSPKDNKVVLLKVEKNMIVEVPGDSEKANELRELIAQNSNNANIAELAFGLNELARPFIETECKLKIGRAHV